MVVCIAVFSILVLNTISNHQMVSAHYHDGGGKAENAIFTSR